MVKFAALFLTGLLFINFAVAEETAVSDAPLKAQAKLELQKADSKDGNVVIEIQLIDPYKAYADRFKLSVEEPPDATLEPFKLSPVVQFMDTFTKKMKDGIKHNGTMTAKLNLKSADPKSVKLKLTYQACTTEHCLFPKNIVLSPTVSFKSSVAEVAANVDRAPAQTDRKSVV